MTSSLFAANALFAPLQHLVRSVARVFAAPTMQRSAPATKPSAQDTAAAQTPASAPRRLRVVRVLEEPSAISAGRMVISGRMADVCAELERLAALEADHELDRGLSLRA